MNHSDSYWQGYHAFQSNMSILDNAYNSGTQEYNDWKSGWYAAQLEFEEVVYLW